MAEAHQELAQTQQKASQKTAVDQAAAVAEDQKVAAQAAAVAQAQQEAPQETAVAQAAAVAEAQQVAAQAVAEDRAAAVAAGYQESFQTQQEAAQAAAVDEKQQVAALPGKTGQAVGDTLGRDVVLQSGLAKLHKASRVYHWQCVNQRGGWKDSSVRGGVCDPDTGLGGCFVEALLTLWKCTASAHPAAAAWAEVSLGLPWRAGHVGSPVFARFSCRVVSDGSGGSGGLLQPSSAPAQHEAMERRGDSPRRGAVMELGLHSL